MSIWISKNITVDLPVGSTIDELLNVLYDIKKEYGNMKFPTRLTLSLSNHTSDEVTSHYEEKVDGI